MECRVILQFHFKTALVTARLSSTWHKIGFWKQIFQKSARSDSAKRKGTAARSLEGHPPVRAEEFAELTGRISSEVAEFRYPGHYP